jgi:dTDP-4-amino-4,6-dideoxygalactose transaminase
MTLNPDLDPPSEAIVVRAMGRDRQAGAPIPLTLPNLEGNEQLYMVEALTRSRLSGDGPFTKRAQELLEELLGVDKALLTTSCTSALDMTALLLDIQPGDEVIVPAFTFVSSINAYVMRGAKPVFADIRADTLNIDESKLEALVTPRTKVIVVVHYAGVACAMDSIMQVADRHGVAVVEDNAHGLFASYCGRHLGTYGRLATLSFHETKNFTCGEGGALLINDRSLIPRAEVIREKGTNRTQFFRGQVDKYTWVDIGSSYLPSDLLAAMLLGQLEARNRIQRMRERIWNYYFARLRDWALEQDVRLPIVPPEADQAYHLFYLLLPDLAERQRLIQHLAERGIQSAFHYQPLHLSRMGLKQGGRQGQCPVTERIADTLLRLPFYNRLDEDDLERVVDAVTSFRVDARSALTGPV